MFTGIIESIGEVLSLADAGGALKRLTVRGPDWLARLDVGASVAVDGVCLTVVEATGHPAGAQASFEVMLQTLELTTTGALVPGRRVNLERGLRAQARLDGHLVQGHVDARAQLLHRHAEQGNTRLRVQLPAALAPLVAAQGSVALAGVSLTVSEVSGAKVENGWFEVALIPETLQATTLGAVAVGDHLNVEVDVVARYAARLAQFDAARLDGARMASVDA